MSTKSTKSGAIHTYIRVQDKLALIEANIHLRHHLRSPAKITTARGKTSHWVRVDIDEDNHIVFFVSSAEQAEAFAEKLREAFAVLAPAEARQDAESGACPVCNGPGWVIPEHYRGPAEPCPACQKQHAEPFG